MASTRSPRPAPARLGELRSKAALFDALVERLAEVEDELERVRDQLRHPRRDGIDPAWRAIANDLAGALRPMAGCFGEQRIENGRIVVCVRVPGAQARVAHRALERLARQVAVESYRAHGIGEQRDRGDEPVARQAA